MLETEVRIRPKSLPELNNPELAKVRNQVGTITLPGAKTVLGIMIDRNGDPVIKMTKEEFVKEFPGISDRAITLKTNPLTATTTAVWNLDFFKELRLVLGYDTVMLNKNVEIDRLWLHILRNVPYYSRFVDSSLGSSVLYYLEDYETEVDERMAKRTKKEEIINFIKSLNSDELKSFATIFGYSPKSFNEKIIRNKFLDVIEESEAKGDEIFLFMKNPTLRYATELLENARFESIVQHNATGYYYHERLIGVTGQEAVTNLMSKEYADLAAQINSDLRLAGYKMTAPKGSAK